MKKTQIVFALTFLALTAYANESEHDHHMPSDMDMKMEMDTEIDTEMEMQHHQSMPMEMIPSPYQDEIKEEKHMAMSSTQAYAHVNHSMHESMNIEFTDNADLDFLRGMIPHHQGAVDMAKVQLQYGDDGLLKHLTQRIIRDQEREIKIMKRLIETIENSPSTELEFNPQSTQDFKKDNHVMHMAMNIVYADNADIDFVNGMIPHHEGAVAMAKTVLSYSDNSNVKSFAYSIINAQESEISWMKKWLQRQRLMNALQN